MVYYGRNLLIGIGVVLLGWFLLPHVAFAILALLAFFAYLISLVLHVRTRCWACRGTGRHQGLIFRYADRNCTVCGGQGGHRRWGTRSIGGGLGSEPRPVWAERRGAAARRRRHRSL